VPDAPPANPLRFAIVTGAAAGIGRATTLLLAAAGWRIGAFDLDEQGLRGLAAEAGRDLVFVRAMDVTDEHAWMAAASDFAAWSGGRLHALVNNAGVIAVGPLGDIPLARTRRLIDVNVMGVLNGIHACLPLLAATPGARIVNVSSIAALSGWPYSSAYSASKAAIYNLTEALAAELGPAGITVCDVLPSFVGTELVADDRNVAALRATLRMFSIARTNPTRIARRIVGAMDSRKLHHVVGRQAHVYAFISRYLPPLARALSRLLRRRYVALLEATESSPEANRATPRPVAKPTPPKRRPPP
jgi:NAD(P)-dependent dehydrogenase (short-subunit alcohol dehydrogenase family)